MEALSETHDLNASIPLAAQSSSPLTSNTAITIISQTGQTTSLLNTLSILAQKARILGSSDNPQSLPSFYSNLLILMFNSFQSVVEGGKSALAKLNKTTFQANRNIIIAYSVVLSNIENALSIVYLLFTCYSFYNLQKSRKRAYEKLLAMSKRQMQSQQKHSLEEWNFSSQNKVDDNLDATEYYHDRKIINKNCFEQNHQSEQLSKHNEALFALSKDLKMISPPNEKALLVPLLRQLNCNDEENEQPRGFLRHTVPDTEWEDHLEKQLERLTTSFESLPPAVTGVHITLMLIVFCFNYLVTVVAIEVVVQLTMKFRQFIASLIVSGLRPTMLLIIQFLVLRLGSRGSEIVPPTRIEYPYSTNPVWRSSDHLSDDSVKLASILKGMHTFFLNMHHQVHFGNIEITKTNDAMIYGLPTKRASVSLNARSLLTTKLCFSGNTSICDEISMSYWLARFSDDAPPSLLSLFTRLSNFIEL